MKKAWSTGRKIMSKLQMMIMKRKIKIENKVKVLIHKMKMVNINSFIFIKLLYYLNIVECLYIKYRSSLVLGRCHKDMVKARML